MAVQDEKSAREARLAEALRTNLRKRKAAARPPADSGDRALAVAAEAPGPYAAVRTLIGAAHADGDRVELVLEISSPYAVEGSDETACAVRLVGGSGPFGTPCGKAAFGRDGLEALRKALDLAQVALDLASLTHGLHWPDGRPYDLSASI
jgi:hypothetical protein